MTPTPTPERPPHPIRGNFPLPRASSAAAAPSSPNPAKNSSNCAAPPARKRSTGAWIVASGGREQASARTGRRRTAVQNLAWRAAASNPPATASRQPRTQGERVTVPYSTCGICPAMLAATSGPASLPGRELRSRTTIRSSITASRSSSTSAAVGVWGCGVVGVHRVIVGCGGRRVCPLVPHRVGCGKAFVNSGMPYRSFNVQPAPTTVPQAPGCAGFSNGQRHLGVGAPMDTVDSYFAEAAMRRWQDDRVVELRYRRRRRRGSNGWQRPAVQVKQVCGQVGPSAPPAPGTRGGVDAAAACRLNVLVAVVEVGAIIRHADSRPIALSATA